MLKVGIIVLNWQQPRLTLDTVDSLYRISHQNFDYRIYLVDNHSADNSVAQFQKRYSSKKNFTLIESSENLGYVGGNNLGLKAAMNDNCDYLLIINNDVLVDPFFLEKLLVGSQQYHYDISGPKIYFAKGHEFHFNRYHAKDLGKVIWSAGGRFDWNNVLGSNIGVDEVDHGQYDQTTSNVDFISGCCMLIDAKVIKAIGFFDEKYFMYLEDVDLCQRALKAHYSLGYIPESKIWHINAGSSSSGSSLHDYYLTRNRLLFGLRYANPRANFALFRESIKYIFSTNSVRRQAVLDFYLGRYGRK